MPEIQGLYILFIAALLPPFPLFPFLPFPFPTSTSDTSKVVGVEVDVEGCSAEEDSPRVEAGPARFGVEILSSSSLTGRLTPRE